MPAAVSRVVAAVIASATAAHAGPRDMSQSFREKAVQVCTGDAMRLCTAYLMDEDQMARCMEANRSRLTPSCRVVVDQGLRVYPH